MRTVKQALASLRKYGEASVCLWRIRRCNINRDYLVKSPKTRVVVAAFKTFAEAYDYCINNLAD